MEPSKAFQQLKQFLKTVVHNIIDDRLFFRGTSLAFTSVISMVPLTMIIYSFGGFDQLGDRLIEGLGKLLLPEGYDGFIRAFNTFTTNARRLGTWGTLLFLFAAVMLFNAMETHLNDIFRARPRKGPILRFGMYIASMALISLVFGAGFGPLSGMLDTWNGVMGQLQSVLGPIISIIGSMLGLMLLFWLMSAARVKFKSAALGTFIGAVSLQAAKFGFTLWTTYSARQSIIYGSLVFIPLLLIWLSVAWVIILISAEITYAHQIEAGRKPSLKYATPAEETGVGWKVFLTLAEDFRLGKKPPGIKALSNRLSVDERRVDTILKRLEDGGMVYQVVHHPPGYIPAKAPADLNAAAVFSVITGWNGHHDYNKSDEAFSLIRSGLESSLSKRSVRSFLIEDKTDDET
ncbi:MAG: YihY/virulence factor BrkB family protein [Spirochaetaceae bacterium]|nr:YihY/virulence factor BrkB family protein [Spirochaetaceae bacterium]